MGKGDKKHRAKRKRAKGLPELAETPKREKSGCFVERTRQQYEDPQKTALQARVRQSGGEDTRSGLKAVSAPHMGCQIGMVMDHAITGKGKRDEIAALWRTFTDWCMAESSYRRRYLGQGEHAKGATIQMMPDRMETDQRHSVDLRSEEEKDRAAVAGWMRWNGYLGMLDARHRTALHDARLERADLWADQEPTARGLRALAALRTLHDVVTARG